ncbi:MAG: phosphate acyltransferase PlsX [Gaiellaceae bacterium]|jgi:glycerol-3-phosphate acyltransferase PlsX
MNRPVRVAVDAMGGDNAPEEIIAGALQAASDQIEPILVGRQGIDPGGLAHVVANEVIGMHEKPGRAVRSKSRSSLVVACRLVSEGKADVVVSAGNTGAMLAAGLLVLRRLPGIKRPAIAVVVPSRKGPSVLIDGGANADARPRYLLQFAHMGAVFAEEMLELRNPTVRLLSIGEEVEKGNELVFAAQKLLAASSLNFAGNAESRFILEHVADVLVCDGFTGNIAVKAVEGTARSLLLALRDAAGEGWRLKAGGLLLRPALRSVRAQLDPDTYGGAYLLGLRGLVVIAHGDSSAWAISNAIRLAARGVEHRLVQRIAERMPSRVVASARPSNSTE